MITIYKDKKDIPRNMEYVELNDIFFNKNTVSMLDDRAKEIVEQIDGAKLAGKYKIESKFNGVTLDVDCLSTGCKTVLNVLYSLEEGSVYSDYAIIPFDMDKITVDWEGKKKVIADYEELKEWWNDEE